MMWSSCSVAEEVAVEAMQPSRSHRGGVGVEQKAVGGFMLEGGPFAWMQEHQEEGLALSKARVRAIVMVG